MATESDAIAEADAFNDAFAAPDPAVEPDKGAGDGGEGGPARDAQGRFAGREEPAADGQPQPQDRAQPEPERHHIPLAEHLSERERRQEAERRAAEYERELAAIRRANAEASKPKRERPDLFADPDAYAAYMDEVIAERVADIEMKTKIRFIDGSFADAKDEHGERFDNAYSALME